LRSVVEAPTVFVAFAAGFVSFVSPCCLPLVPGYVAAVTGVAPGESRRRIDPKVVGNSLLFVASFSAVFILLGLSATAIGGFLS
jgi:cytochrome c-type biogenesis protein